MLPLELFKNLWNYLGMYKILLEKVTQFKLECELKGIFLFFNFVEMGPYPASPSFLEGT